ncbi:ethanolamine ammonia-lyase subunit EutC [Agrobacterium vitis]|uniref:Ethanolamine ammonia-lyase small subunit n=2 Tax=Agrobacterium vitis TaxID=373 RepID=A0A1S2E0Z0_AGRVI|nr:ethanolamine ammonia-lyase subunit EutC [Agrobacterium vitis]MUO80881.1 ethanolamine ammonia-lyase subunit EutC [Agrobacterium vitis]MUO94789.1 ethanolamine ammonia-lyase subunit EutC [Agrobacterium vitis]MUP05449.1 ethanolamine ammonia-lyase subunit EutC [Agrobacterium vitis]MUZ75749.1 ethanolamine ammonia-lyase subunit EutC [Agrobacterium vitis]MUZ81557.1 ethanolamine ammonia-lyase subunit EutC [Agrobacterium vitis]
MSDERACYSPAIRTNRLRLPAGVTTARLGLGMVGAGLPTDAALAFTLDHARARDAVQRPLDLSVLHGDCTGLGLEIVRVDSAAQDRQVYLRRPDYGRRLCDNSRAALTARQPCSSDVILVVGDGLSSTAVQAGAPGLLAVLVQKLYGLGLSVGPLVLASQARVALADEIGSLLGARLSIILIGERPGLSASDSLGAYLTWGPCPGRTDAERNCVSNIRPGGLDADVAASKLTWLTQMALQFGLSGVSLKDESTVVGSAIAAT